MPVFGEAEASLLIPRAEPFFFGGTTGGCRYGGAEGEVARTLSVPWVFSESSEMLAFLSTPRQLYGVLRAMLRDD